MTDHNAQAHVTGGLAQYISGAESHRGFMEYLRLKPYDHDKQRQNIESLIRQASSTGEATITLTELLVLRHHYNGMAEELSGLQEANTAMRAELEWYAQTDLGTRAEDLLSRYPKEGDTPCTK